MTEFFARIEKQLDGLAGASMSRLPKRKYDMAAVKANWLAVLEDYRLFPDEGVAVV